MTPHPTHELEISLEDEEHDPLIEKAAALMHRHESFLATEDDDLPVLTDVVDEDARIEPFIGDAPPDIPDTIDEDTILAPVIADDAEPVISDEAAPDLAERIVALDNAITRHVEAWIDNELPQLISRELDEFAERLREKAAAHLRATLLPQISDDIADILDRQPER